MPMGGIFPLQKHIISFGLGVSGNLPLLNVAGPIDNGNKHFQQTSVKGLINSPLHSDAFALLTLSIAIVIRIILLYCLHVFEEPSKLNLS